MAYHAKAAVNTAAITKMAKNKVNAVMIDRSIGMVLIMLAILLIVKTLGLEISIGNGDVANTFVLV